mmetsp:Transcript_31888/g.51287  ORF Transcript_31888/g.51287 Transcript_31888/m.51287 type:complete len:267 (+) Transcript_31888:357-1157(+)
MDIVFTVAREVVVDDKGDLLNVDTTGEEVGGDENPRRSRAEFFHDCGTLFGTHFSMHGADGVITLLHFVREPVDFTTCVTVDDGLCDGEGVIKVAKSLELPILFFDSDIKLLDTVEGYGGPLHENTHRLTHESFRYFKNFIGHGGREQANLNLGGHLLEDVVDLVAETSREHLICLVENKCVYLVYFDGPSTNHIKDTPWSTDNELDTLAEDVHIFADRGTADAYVGGDIQIVSKSASYLLDLLSQLAGGCQNEGLGSMLLKLDLL